MAQDQKIKWQYFGRSGCTSEIFEIYKRSYSDKKIGLLDIVNNLARIRKNGEWVHDPNDFSLFDEMREGWFDFQDEISEELALSLITKWQASGAWPGRL
jgi:hypothetical protein